MSTAQFEVMRAASDRRNTVWAAALAFRARRPEEDAKAELTPVIRQLVEEGDLTVGFTTWSGDSVRLIPLDQIASVLDDESQWHPRSLPWAKRLRLVATDKGQERFWAGEFGSPEPVGTLRNASDLLELQSVTCAEATGMLISVVGFIVGSAIGFIVGSMGVPTSLTDWTTGALIGWIAGGILGLCVTAWAWNSRFPARDADELPENVVPDAYAGGPDLNSQDRFGDPRF